ncbi:hypothetical protein Dda_2192 [Drechslerella dactyloides]|uniref:Uncharacterized protein n=1 Tax=Drechslerella dactyloides TaxID=74499 RepID=A0AAD6J323_DREDA|nr:hypothetical protein Dda_2192 [Drechslerella dactyloides]
MASGAPKRRLRDPNEIFASIDRPLSSPFASPDGKDAAGGVISSASSPIKPTPFSSPPASASPSPRPAGKPQIFTSRRVLSISKRFSGTGSLLRRAGSPPRGRRSPPPRRVSARKTSGTGRGGIKPPLDLGPQHSPHDTVNVRERVRKWQAAGGGVIEAEANNYVPPPPVNATANGTPQSPTSVVGAGASARPRSSSRSPEKRRTMLADYTINHNFDELETSSARWGREPLALPAPPALSAYGSNAGSWKGSRAGSVVSNRDVGEWEDANSVVEMSRQDDRDKAAAWNSAPEDRGSAAPAKKKKKRVPRDGMDVDEIRARKERRKKRLVTMSSTGNARETDAERNVKATGSNARTDAHDDIVDPTDGGVSLLAFDIPGSELEATDDVAVVPTAVLNALPPPIPAHAGQSIRSLDDPSAPHSLKSAKSLDHSLSMKKSNKSLDGKPAVALKSAKSLEGTSIRSDDHATHSTNTSLLDDDGIRVTPISRKATKAEKHQRHKQRQAELIEREKNRVREEERLRYQQIERIREEARQEEIERIKEEERQRELERIKDEECQRALDEERIREEERQKIREREKEERRRKRNLIHEQERKRQIERIREEETLKVIEEMRREQERERLELERERALLEEQRQLAREQELARREEERREEIMTEIERATQRSTTRARKKRKDKESVVAEEVQKRVGPDALRTKEEMAEAIKAAVREVMGEMFGEIIFEDEHRAKDHAATNTLTERSNVSSNVTTDIATSVEIEEQEHITRETTPDVDKRSPKVTSPKVERKSLSPKLERSPPVGHNDITFRAVEFKRPEAETKRTLDFKRSLDFRRPDAEAKKPADVKKFFDVRKAEFELKRPSEIKKAEVEAKKAEAEAKRAEAEAKKAIEVKKSEAELKKQLELKRSEAELKKPTEVKTPEVLEEPASPPLPPHPAVEDTPASPSSPETPTKTSLFSIPKRRINLFGSQTAKRRRKPFQSTIPEESASQLSAGDSEPTSPPPSGTRIFSFAPRTAAEPISPPTRQISAASSSHHADAASPPARQISLASSSNHTNHSAATTSQIHRNLPDDENLNLPGQNMSSGLTRSLTSPAAHTNLAKTAQDEDPGDEYFVSVHEPLYRGSGIKRYKSTADLISILSERRPSSSTRAKSVKSIKSARSIRSVKNKVVVGTLTLTDLLAELAADEFSYTEDLQLLEHRIVPVLLDAKLAKTDQEAVAGKRMSPEKLIENNPLKSIVDVSIALKRINGIHERLADAIKAATTRGLTAPRQDDAATAISGVAGSGGVMANSGAVSVAPNPEEILKWAQAAKYVYEDYVACWKMDWDQVVISSQVLEAIERKKEAAASGAAPPAGSGAGSAPVNGDFSSSAAGAATSGRTIDVGYLLKRPLVRTRVLTKFFKRINYLSPSPLAEEAFISFQTLVGAARHKVAEERARLEDEAAACIDASRVRDLQTLEICYGVVIDPHRRVRARDIFEMKLRHSQGKTLAKTVELYLRDEAKSKNSKTASSDSNPELLICELAKDDPERKWLAFQPLPVKWISAKQGTNDGDLLLDVNARLSDGSRWHERMTLTADPMIKMEWLHLLGAAADEVAKASRMHLDVRLPSADEDFRQPILAEIDTQLKSLGIDADNYSEPPTPGMSIVSEIDRIPESDTALMNEGEKPGKPTVAVVVIPGVSDLYDGGALAVPVYGELPHIVQMMPHYVGKKRMASPPPSTISPMSSASYGPARLQRRRTRHEQRRMAEVKRKEEEMAKKQKEAQAAATAKEAKEEREQEGRTSPTKKKSGSPFKLRNRSQSPTKTASLSFNIATSPPTPPRAAEHEKENGDALSADEASLLSWTEENLKFGRQKGGYGLADGGLRRRARSESESSGEGSSVLSGSTRSSATQQAKSSTSARSRASGSSAQEEEDAPPPVPLHTSPSQEDLRSVSSTSSGGTVRNASQTSSPSQQVSQNSHFRGALRRRLSSPLKHEYAPSSATESDGGSRSPGSLTDSDSDSPTDSEPEDDDDDRSDDELSTVPPQIEDEDGDIPGPMFEDMIAGRNLHSAGRKDAMPSYDDMSRRVSLPRHSAKGSASGYSTNAFVYTWSKNAWEKISEEESRLLVLDNFIEVYAVADGPSGKPLMSLEVTPAMPIRRGTAVDLSIRAEPRAKFQGGSVMFRSRTQPDCDALYNAINTGRINACNHGFGGGRPARKTSIGRNGSVRGYRAVNVDAPAVSSVNSGPAFPGETASIIMSETSSLGSLGSAFSAFKGTLRNSIFGGQKSSNGSSWMSSSSTSSGLAGPRGIINPLGGIPITGIGGEAPYDGTGYVSNLKIKLWKRERSGNKWADLGPGRLNIITPPPGHAARGGGGLNAGEKRVVIRDRKGQNTLLDVVLGEACFEKVARTGIAVHVPVEDDGFVPTLVNAGSAGRSSVYMLQFKGENETKETFRIVGRKELG